MNKKILTPLFVAASFLLIGCSTSEIIARPNWIDDPIVVDPTNLDDNKMKEIYDAIKKLGDTNSNVLNKVMYDIAKKQIGTFVELAKFKNDSVNPDEFKKFVDNHPIYKSDDRGGEIIDGAAKVRDLTAEEKTKVSRIKIEQQYNAIIERMFEKLFNDIKGGSYNTDATFKLFSEDIYVRHLKKELYEPDPKGYDLSEGKQVFLPKQTGSNWKEYVNFINGSTTDVGFLHVMDAEGKLTSIYAKEIKDDKNNVVDYDGYIGRKILPETYRELLIETYVREQRYTNLGRSYARKVKMATIPHGSYKGEIDSMLIKFVKNHITGSPDESIVATSANLDELSKIMIGYATAGSIVDTYLKESKFVNITIPNTSTPLSLYMCVDEDGETIATPSSTKAIYAYKGTKMGDIVEKFLKAYTITYSEAPTTLPVLGNFNYTPKVPFTDEAKTAYNDLTNNGAYPIEVGLEIKEREALLTDMTQDGWYLKDGGLTDLNEEPRNRLFNIATSNQIDTKKAGSYESGDYIRYFNIEDSESAYLIKSNISDKFVWNSLILDYGDNFYIVQVDEAASSSKLSVTDEKSSYLAKKATADITDSNAAMNDVVCNITKQVGSSDTYKKNAEQYYLMISNILFYDQSVYDYFKSQFPDLFK